MTEAEILTDLESTKRDIIQLETVIHALSIFVNEPGGENRDAFRVDLFKYSGLLERAKRLLPKIETALTVTRQQKEVQP